MTEKITGSFLSANKESNIAYYVWAPEKPRAVIQISHGMCEYIERYAPHAEFFCSQGIALAGNDHLGHGRSAKDEHELGYTYAADFMVDDLASMTDILKERFPGVPVFLLGHSMGSFLLREYMTKYSDKLAGAIISGTAGPDNPTVLGKALAAVIGKIKGDHHRSGLLFMLSIGSYSKPFGKDAEPECWLTRDKSVTEAYKNDKFCHFVFTANGYVSLFDVLGRVSKKSWAQKTDKDLPVLLISGSDDPVGSFGKGVKKVHERLSAAGTKDLSLVLIDGARHEPFNELEPAKSEALNTVCDWINKRI
jgi:alpha-beta hydrolase superfamily lysophospholipase